MKKRVLAIMLTLCMVLAATPAVFAGIAQNSLTIHDGTKMEGFLYDDVRSGAGWSWDGKGTLTLDGFHGHYIGIYGPSSCVISLAEGSENSVTYDEKISSNGCAILFSGVDYGEIQGKGSLSVEGGIEVDCNTNKPFYLKDSTLTLTKGTGSEYAEQRGLEVSGDMVMTSGNIAASVPIQVSKTITVNGGNITATEEIDISGDMTMNNGSITASEIGVIHVRGNFNMVGGSVSVKLRNDVENPDGSYTPSYIDCLGDFTQTGGKFEIRKQSAVEKYSSLCECQGTASILGGTFMLEGGTMTVQSVTLGTGFAATGGETASATETLELYKLTPDSEIYWFCIFDPNAPAGLSGPPATYIYIAKSGTTPSTPTTPTEPVKPTDPAKPTEPTKPIVSGFQDVFADAYYADAVKWAVDNGVTTGTSKTAFSPNDSCTRAQAVTFLWRAAGSPEPLMAEGPFTDVAPGSYYEKAVLWAMEQGITTGTGDTTFSPNETCNRAQIVTFLWRMEGKESASGSNAFTDVEAGKYYEDAVLWAVENEITNGTSDTTFSPLSNCTRAQIVTFLYRDMA